MYSEPNRIEPSFSVLVTECRMPLSGLWRSCNCWGRHGVALGRIMQSRGLSGPLLSMRVSYFYLAGGPAPLGAAATEGQPRREAPSGGMPWTGGT